MRQQSNLPEYLKAAVNIEAQTPVVAPPLLKKNKLVSSSVTLLIV